MLEFSDKLIEFGEKLADNTLVALLLTSLPESYSTLITALQGRDEKDITPKFVKSKLIDEYNRRKEGAETNQQRSDDTVMKASQTNTTSIKKIVCFFCKRP